MNATKHVALLTSNIFGRGFDSRRLHHYKIFDNKLVTKHKKNRTINVQWIRQRGRIHALCLLPPLFSPARPTTSTTSAAAVRSGSMVSSDRMGHSFAVARRRGVGKRQKSSNDSWSLEYEAKQNGDREVVALAPEKISVKDAVSRFITSKRNENLAESTLGKLKTIFEKQFLSWATDSRLKHLEDITTADLEAFRDTWEDGPLAKKKKQERLIGFFYYCLRLGWIKSNPAVSLGRIRADGPPTDYFPKNEFEQIVDATYIYQPKGWVECRNQATRLRILTLLMRWSGLAIRDAVTLERRRVNDKDELFLYRAKTGNPVYVPLPPDVAESLRTIPPGPSPNPRYFFWSGNGSPKSVVGNWQRSFRRLFKDLQPSARRWNPKALPSAHVSRHIRG